MLNTKIFMENPLLTPGFSNKEYFEFFN